MWICLLFWIDDFVYRSAKINEFALNLTVGFSFNVLVKWIAAIGNVIDDFIATYFYYKENYKQSKDITSQR